MSAKEIREIISNYLAGGNADKFIKEFAAASYNVHKNADPEAIELVSKVEAKMADLHHGFVLQDSFKKQLFELIANVPPASEKHLVVVYSNSARILPDQNNTSNGPQNAQLGPAPHTQSMLPVLFELVGSH